jgi:hypothetical protein
MVSPVREPYLHEVGKRLLTRSLVYVKWRKGWFTRREDHDGPDIRIFVRCSAAKMARIVRMHTVR